MRKFLNIINTVKWLGFIGILGNILNIPILQLFNLFFLLFFVDILVKPKFYLQSFMQLIGIPIIHIKNKFNMPSLNNYTLKSNYVLPFKGEWTVINGGVYKELSHSWSMGSQRYAYDFLMMDEEGKTYRGDFNKAESYYCYGKDIIAPEDGTIVYIYDKCKDSKIYGNGKIDSFVKDIRGNTIVTKHNDQEYSLVAHIMPNSIQVKKGQSVKKGDTIAKCGNSGNSTEPHIHFQIMNGKNFFTSAGLPIAFENIMIEEKDYYNQLDHRPIPTINNDTDSNGLEGNKKYIRRGQNVKNNAYS